MAVGGVKSKFIDGNAKGGSSDPTAVDDSAPYLYDSFPAQNEGDRTAGAEWSINTQGFDNVVITWDQYHSHWSPRHARFQYWTGLAGTTWTDAGPVFTATGGDTWHKDRTVDLTGKAGVADNPEFRFRVVATFKPNTTGYERSSGRGNYGDAS